MIHTTFQDQHSIDDVNQYTINKINSNSTQEDCPLCSQPSLQILINNALYHKYLDAQYINYLKYFDNIMDDQICTEVIKFKEMTVMDQDEEFMRRMYNFEEYDNKNKAIVDYYKFHQDYPKLHIKGVSNLMEHFYDRKKQFQYKKIKRILKEQQDISITTQKSSQIFSDIQEDQKKSNYSNVLNDLTQNSQLFNQETNESLIWKNMCKKIDKAFQNKSLSPINFKKNSIFDQTQQKQSNQTKNFMSYLKKQQQKKQKQEKYKNFIRSNKVSSYNSIDNSQSKKYSSGVTSSSNLIKKLLKKQKSKPLNSFKGTSVFYDGKLFYNSNSKAYSGSYGKDQKTKQQSNTPSQDNFDFDYCYAQNGFKKNKDPNNNAHLNVKQQGQYLFQREINKNKAEAFNSQNFKNKTNLKTTEEIYKNATQELKLKKRSLSYNSLANTNSSSKRSSVVNILALKQKDFEGRNRASSQNVKFLKQKKNLINQLNSKTNQNQTKLQRVKSSNQFRTSRSVPKFYQAETLIQSENKLLHSSTKKISVPKQVMQSLKGKSFSASKFKTIQSKYTIQSRQKQKDLNNKQIIIGKLQKQDDKQRKNSINLFIQNGIKLKDQIKDLFIGQNASKNINIDKILSAKLIGNSSTQKTRKHKILI